ncbi:hypothetical protein [uncultured Fibrobacter sp.]|uniref:hypothetical protein n=1 Tax=uncultured Fibrobacter sp. TaxID=261512 RepID=UPI0025FB045B|nr:hypothetical protein [uncultured Fibrobacter sp.]
MQKNAGTWINLQDAYVLESKDNALGDWIAIGYTAPGRGSSNSYDSDNFKYTNATNNVWTAAAINALNDCPQNGTWTLAPSSSTTDPRAVNYTMGGNGNCTALTPSFKQLEHTDR